MPRVQVYLPDDLYAELKQRKLRASELLQSAVRAEVRRQQLMDAAEEFLQELITESGEPSAEALAWAQDLAQHLKERQAETQSEAAPQKRAS